MIAISEAIHSGLFSETNKTLSKSDNFLFSKKLCILYTRFVVSDHLRLLI